MKKLFVVFLICIFVGATCFATETPTISLVQKETDTDGEICISVQISENSRVCGGKIDIFYNNALLEPKSYEIADEFSSGMFLANLNYDNNTIRLSWAGTDEIISGGTMCTLAFSVVEDKSFSSTLQIAQCKLADVNSEPVVANTANADITYNKHTNTSSRPGGSSGSSSKNKLPEEKEEQSETILTFADVKTTDWFYDSVKYVSDAKLMNGISDTEFAPHGSVTRAMLVTVLYRSEGEPDVTQSDLFVDVDMSAWYANAVLWAKQNAIVNGISESEFAPDVGITREQIATIMHRYAMYKGYDVTVGESTNILSYEDVQSVSEYAVSAMQYAVGSGLMKGKSDVTLNPLDSASRAEIAAILQRYNANHKTIHE